MGTDRTERQRDPRTLQREKSHTYAYFRKEDKGQMASTVVTQPRRADYDGRTVDELVQEIKQQQFGEGGLIRDWSQKTQLELLVEKEREKQEKKRLKRENKARRKEQANEAKLAPEERKKLEKMRQRQIEREEKAREAEEKMAANKLASFM